MTYATIVYHVLLNGTILLTIFDHGQPWSLSLRPWSVIMVKIHDVIHQNMANVHELPWLFMVNHNGLYPAISTEDKAGFHSERKSLIVPTSIYIVI